MRGPQWASFSPLSKALADLVCSSLQAAYSACRIDCCHKNSSQIIATVHQYLAWVRTLLSVCWIGCDILGLDKAAQSMWAFVVVLHWLRKRQSKGKRWILFFEAFLDAQLVGCCSFIYLFRVVSGFDVQCYFLQLWCRWQDAKGFVLSPLGLALGKAFLMLFVITVHWNQGNMRLWKYVVNYTKGIIDNRLLTSANFKLNLTFS